MGVLSLDFFLVETAHTAGLGRPCTWTDSHTNWSLHQMVCYDTVFCHCDAPLLNLIIVDNMKFEKG